MSRCPDCDAPIEKRTTLRIGQRFRCPECGADLEIICYNPIEVDYYLDDDDWYEDEDNGRRKP
jgi:lysine biosynthesis protein LysW